MARHLRRQGRVVGRKRIRRLTVETGPAGACQRPRATVPPPARQEMVLDAHDRAFAVVRGAPARGNYSAA